MKIRTSKIGAVLAALSVMGISSLAAASSHREAPGISDDPAADNTDTYAWVDSTTGNLVVVANYIGLELPEGGPNWAKFSDDVLYEIHIAHGGKSLSDALTYQIKFNTARPKYQDPSKVVPAPANGVEFFGQLTGSGAFNQTYSVTQLKNGKNETKIAHDVVVPPPNVGPATNAVAYAIPNGTSYESFFLPKAVAPLTGGGQVFAGPRDDPFFVDLGAIFDLAQVRPVANPSEAARDSIAYMNVHSIVLAIPLATANLGKAVTPGAGDANQTVGVWASASRRKTHVLRRDSDDEDYGPWRQVSRLGIPLVNEAVIGLQDKDYWNRLTPADDLTMFGSYFLNPIAVRDAEAVGFYKPNAPLAACTGNGGTDLESNRTDIIGVINIGNAGITSVGDVLRVDLGAPPTAAGKTSFPNGRSLTDDVVAVELDLLLCKLALFDAAKGQDGFPAGPTGNEPEAKTTTTFPYLAPPWEGRSANPRPVPSLP